MTSNYLQTEESHDQNYPDQSKSFPHHAPPLPNPSLLMAIDRIRARRCALLGFDSVQKNQDINAAIMLVLQAGYVVREPGASD